MNTRTRILVLSLVFATTILVGLFFYGPSQRRFVSPQKVELVADPYEILDHWWGAGVRGRIAVVFSRRLNAVEPAKDGSEKKYLQEAMHRGIVRKVLHVIPDVSWPEVSNTLKNAPKTEGGIKLLFDEGRVVVAPLSLFLTLAELPEEKVLVVVEQAKWNQQEIASIGSLFKGHKISADYISVIGNDMSVVSLFVDNK